jgi:hypothetical protein
MRRTTSGRGRGPSARLALFAPFDQLLLNDLQQPIVIQGLIGMPHPGLPQIGHCFADEAIGEAALQAAGNDHAVRSFASSLSSRNKYWFSSLIASRISFARW